MSAPSSKFWHCVAVMVGAQLHPRRWLPSQSTVSVAEAVIAPNRAARPSKSFFMYDEGISFGKLSVGRFVRRKCTSTFTPPQKKIFNGC